MATDPSTVYTFPDPPESAYSFDRKPANYFLFKRGRLPKLRFDPKPDVIDPDVDNSKWDALLISRHYSFITQKQLNDFGVAANSIIRDDVKILNRVLVRAFIDEDYNATYWQNAYFLFQWMFTIFALLATICATLAAAATVSEAAVTSGLRGFGWAGFFGLLTTIMGVIVTILVYVYNRDRPQRTWYEKRRNAESLRKQYFLYLTHMPPYDNLKYLYALQKTVVRTQASDNTPQNDILPDTLPRSPTHTPDDSSVLIRLYNALRIQEQMAYYKMRNREYDFNADITLLLTLIIPLVVSILAGLNIAQISPVLAVIVVVLPNVAGLFATFQHVYNWDPQQLLYKKTFEGLQQAKIIDIEGKMPDAILRELVDAIEGELTKESDQWGASLNEGATELSAEQIIDAFKKKVDATDEEVSQLRRRLGLKQ